MTGGVTSSLLARQTGMRTDTTNPAIDALHTLDTPKGGSSRWAIFWITLITLFLGLSLVWPARAEKPTASATRSLAFGPLDGVRSVAVDNVNGDVELTAGTAFSATVELKASASDQKQADARLAGTDVTFTHQGDSVSLETVWPVFPGVYLIMAGLLVLYVGAPALGPITSTFDELLMLFVLGAVYIFWGVRSTWKAARFY